MTDNEKAKAMASIYLFQSLPMSQILLIAQATKERLFPTQTLFVDQGEEPDGAYFLIEGSVRVFRMTEEGESVTLAILGAGEVIGEMSLIDDEPRSASVETIQDSKMLLLTKKEFSNLIASHPEIALDMMYILTKRMRALNQYMEDALSKNLHDRTWKTVKALSNYFPNKDISLTQEELSNVVGATRARVTEILNALQKEGKITLSHKKIHLN